MGGMNIMKKKERKILRNEFDNYLRNYEQRINNLTSLMKEFVEPRIK